MSKKINTKCETVDQKNHVATTQTLNTEQYEHFMY